MTRPLHNLAYAAAIIGLVLATSSTATRAETIAETDGIQAAIDDAKSAEVSPEKRLASANTLKERWKEALPALIENIDRLHRLDEGRPYAQEDVPSLLPLTDILMSILLNSEGSVQEFRRLKTNQTSDMLVWAARAPEQDEQSRNLRYNATYILASTVDASIFRTVLFGLEGDDLAPHAMNNLLQVANIGVVKAYREDALEATHTIERLMRNYPEVQYGKLGYLAMQLDERAAQQVAVASPRPPDWQPSEKLIGAP